MKVLKLGTRPSRLAIKQAEEIAALTPSIRFEIITIDTKGDKDKRTPLYKTEETDFFTKELEEALLSGDIDAAIHSAKDIENVIPEGLMIVATTASISPYECLVSPRYGTLTTLPPGAVIGTSSRKRKIAIHKFRDDLVMKDIRGSIEERLEQLDRGYFDAVIVAHAALIRLGYEDRISEIIPPDVIEPHPLQGRLAVQVRKDRLDLIKIFRGIDA